MDSRFEHFGIGSGRHTTRIQKWPDACNSWQRKLENFGVKAITQVSLQTVPIKVLCKYMRDNSRGNRKISQTSLLSRKTM